MLLGKRYSKGCYWWKYIKGEQSICFLGNAVFVVKVPILEHNKPEVKGAKVYIKNLVVLYDWILNIFELKPSNDKDITELSALELYRVKMNYLM